MNKKIAIVLIALIGIGLYALPQTMALFAGQHSFYNIDPTGNQVPCDKCHGDVQAELASGISTLTGTPGPHAAMKCEFCHRLQIGQSSGDDAYALLEYRGTAVNGTGSNVNARRYLAMKLTDYEAQLYPANITNNASTTSITFGGTAGGSISPLYNPGGTWSYANTTFGWNVTQGTRMARQTDVINTTGVGTVVWIPRATIYALYNNSQPIDQNSTTRFDAFNPAFVTWNVTNQTDATTQPPIILDGAGSRTVNSGSKYHAASLVACMDCHAGTAPQPGHETARLGQTTPTDEEFCHQCHYGTEEPGHIITTQLSAGGFGMGLTNEVFDTGAAEVHKPMVNAQDSISVFGGRYAPASNDACISCHTHVDVQIQFTRPTTLVYAANEFSDGNWSIGGFTATGSNTTTG